MPGANGSRLMRSGKQRGVPRGARMARVRDGWARARRSWACSIGSDGSESPGADLRHAGSEAKEFPDHYTRGLHRNSRNGSALSRAMGKMKHD